MNESVYSGSFPVEAQQLDSGGKLKLSSLLYFVQEISGQHAADLGTGWEVLWEKDLFWAVIRHRVLITRLPGAGETLQLQTWPMPTTRTAYPRATVAYDGQGREVFRTVALWVLMDKNKRTMVLPGKSGVSVPGFLRGGEPELPGSLAPAALANSYVRRVSAEDLDRNGHMNNTRYLDWVDGLPGLVLPPEHIPTQLNLCYLTEARQGQEVSLSWEMTDGNTLRLEACVAADDGENPHRIFGAGITFSPEQDV